MWLYHTAVCSEHVNYMSFIIEIIFDRLCCNIDHHKTNILDRNKRNIYNNKACLGTIFCVIHLS